MRFSRKNSREILANFGTRAFKDSADNDEDLILPGMKRGLILEDAGSGIGASGSNMGGGGDTNTATNNQIDDASSLLMQVDVNASGRSSFDQPNIPTVRQTQENTQNTQTFEWHPWA